MSEGAAIHRNTHAQVLNYVRFIVQIQMLRIRPRVSCGPQAILRHLSWQWQWINCKSCTKACSKIYRLNALHIKQQQIRSVQPSKANNTPHGGDKFNVYVAGTSYIPWMAAEFNYITANWWPEHNHELIRHNVIASAANIYLWKHWVLYVS